MQRSGSTTRCLVNDLFMKNRWFLILILFLAGCQFSEPPSENSLTGGPSLHAFPQIEGIGLVWNSYILPYYVPSNDPDDGPVSYHVLVSETGPDELSRIAELEENTFQFSAVGETAYWFAIEAEYKDGNTARSNIVMSTSSSAQVTTVAALEPLEFSAEYSELASGFPLFQVINSQAALEIHSLSPTESSQILTLGKNPAPHPSKDQFLYLSDPDNLVNSPRNSNSLLLWNFADSSVNPLIVGAAYLDKPAWSHDGSRIVYLSSNGPGEPTSINIMNLDSTAIFSSPITSVNDRYSGGGIDGPNFPSFFPGKEAIVIDVPSIDSSTIGRNIFLKSIDGGVDSLLIQSPWVDTQPVVHPDGRMMVFVSDRAGSPAIWGLEFSSGKLSQLSGKSSDPIVSRDYPLTWSSDGKILWYTGTKAGKTSCYQLIQ